MVNRKVRKAGKGEAEERKEEEWGIVTHPKQKSGCTTGTTQHSYL